MLLLYNVAYTCMFSPLFTIGEKRDIEKKKRKQYLTKVYLSPYIFISMIIRNVKETNNILYLPRFNRLTSQYTIK